MASDDDDNHNGYDIHDKMMIMIIIDDYDNHND